MSSIRGMLKHSRLSELHFYACGGEFWKNQGPRQVYQTALISASRLALAAVDSASKASLHDDIILSQIYITVFFLAWGPLGKQE